MLVTAMVTPEQMQLPMVGHPGIAPGTVSQPTAGMAGQYRRISPPVQKQHRLFTRSKGLFEVLDQSW
jgi:hypothetical protein